MRIPRVFVDQEINDRQTLGLESKAAHYVTHVLRCGPGSRLTLFNGLGGAFTGTITRVGKRSAEVLIDTFDPEDRESPLDISLGLGIIKRDAMDSAIQKATELGVRQITPVICEYTDSPKKALLARQDHWQAVARSACEQCERNRPPRIDAPISLPDWLAGTTSDIKLIAHPGSHGGLDAITVPPTSVTVLTGPEGGFSDAEVSRCVDSGFHVVGLGPRILRADTAPLVMLALLQARFGDL